MGRMAGLLTVLAVIAGSARGATAQMTVSQMRKRKADAKAAEQLDAASIKCDMCPVMLEHVWREMGATAKQRDARSHHFVMSVLEEICEEGEEGEPAFFSGHQLVRGDASDGSPARLKIVARKPNPAVGAGDAGMSDEAVTADDLKIVRRACIDIADHFDQDFGVVVHNSRFKPWGGVKEQICYWLLKCDPAMDAQRAAATAGAREKREKQRIRELGREKQREAEKKRRHDQRVKLAKKRAGSNSEL